MAEKKKMVTAVFRDRANAQRAYDQLLERGYRSDEVNVLMSDATRAQYFPHDKDKDKKSAGTHAEEGMGIGGAIGTAVGATLAAVAAIGTSIMIPGLGIIIAGPIAAALAGAGAGGVAGGLIGGLVGLGIPEPNAQAYMDVLREGGVVIGVVPRNDDDASKLKTTFQNLQGENICYC
jgi:hypothetical protein